VKPQSFLIVCRSEWQTPQNRILRVTSSSPFSLQKKISEKWLERVHLNTIQGEKIKEKNLLEKLKGERVAEVSEAAQPKAFSGSSVSYDFAICILLSMLSLCLLLFAT
jgi:hypothetical protein